MADEIASMHYLDQKRWSKKIRTI